jgi:hypothetical protein
VLYGADEEGNEWKVKADLADIRLKRDGTFDALLRRGPVWGECDAQIIQLAGFDREERKHEVR